jgi:hypothetical protein
VRGQKVDAAQDRRELGPQLTKARLPDDVFPGDAVQMREDELPPRRTDEMALPLDDLVALDPD